MSALLPSEVFGELAAKIYDLSSLQEINKVNERKDVRIVIKLIDVCFYYMSFTVLLDYDSLDGRIIIQLLNKV